MKKKFKASKLARLMRRMYDREYEKTGRRYKIMFGFHNKNSKFMKKFFKFCQKKGYDKEKMVIIALKKWMVNKK